MWLPDNHFRDQLLDEEQARQLETASHFTKLLRDIDPYLELVFVGERAPRDFGLEPGRWHVMRRNPGTVNSFMAITGPNKEYREPDSAIFDQLLKWDSWNGGHKRMKAERARVAAEKERKYDLEREQLRDELALRLKSKLNPSMRFGGTGWTNKAGAPRWTISAN